MRVAIGGAGMITAHHLPAWRAAGAEVVAVADPDLARAEARARAFGIPRVYADVATMLEDSRPDVLDVASPRAMHAEHVRLAATRGAAVLCQKPLAPTLAEAEALVVEVAGRCRLMVHENWRFRPQYRQAKTWLEQERLGTITGLSLVLRSSGFLPDAEGRHPALERQPFMRTEPRLMLAETLIHHLDVARWLAGPLELLGAQTLRAAEACRGETAASILLRTASGAPVLVEGHGACPGYPPRGQDRLELIGTKASIRFDGRRLELLGPEPAFAEYDPDAAYQASFDACITHFLSCLRSGAAFETAPADNLQTLRLIEAAYTAAGSPRALEEERG